MKVRCLLVVLFAAGLLFAVSSEARIDPETIAGMWLFDEDEGDVANDSSGNGNNGALINGPDWDDGKFGSALEFDGASTYVNCARIHREVCSLLQQKAILMLLSHMQDGGSLMTIETMVKALTILASVIRLVDGQAAGIIFLDVTSNLTKESGIM